MKFGEDLTGKRFGKLTVEGFDHYANRMSYWRCRCDCGNVKIIGREYLRNGHATACGCMKGKSSKRGEILFKRADISEKDLEWIKTHYKHTKNADIMEKFGISDGSLHRLAREFGLTKSKQFLKKVQTEAKNAATGTQRTPPKGYSIPGGEKHRFKKGNKPKNTPESRARGIEKRKQTIKEDRARIMFGLPQKTKVKLTKQPKKKICQRSYLRKLGYIIERGSDIAYYTPETRRSETFENRKYGDKNYQYFNFRPYDKSE